MTMPSTETAAGASAVGIPPLSAGEAKRTLILVVALCFAVTVLEGFDIQAMGVASPRMAPELGLGPDQMGLVFSISNIGLAIGAAFGGWLADKVGRKPIFIGSIVMFGVFTLATMVSGTFEMLALVRFLTGLGLGAAMPNLISIASEVSPPGRRTLITSLIFCGMPLGGAVVAMVAALLPEGSDWRLLFLIGGVAPLLLVPAFMLFLKEKRPTAARAAERRVQPFEVLFGGGRARATALIWLAFFPTLMILYLLLNWLPTLAVAKGMDPGRAPLVAMAFNLGSVVGALILAALSDRFGPRWPLTLAFAVFVGTIVALSATSGDILILTLCALAGFCLLGSQYALYGVTASYYPAALRGTGAGAAVSVGRIGAIAGPAIGGAMLGAGADVSAVLLVMTPIAVVAGTAVLILSFVAPHGDAEAEAAPTRR